MTGSVVALGVAVTLAMDSPPVSFEAMTSQFAQATEEYRQLWAVEGLRMIAGIEAVAGFSYPKAPLTALVREGPSMMAADGSSMRLRASYNRDLKKAVLVHELGHRLALTLPRPAGIDDHRLLYLFLYDVWCDLYGEEFAKRMVEIERRSKAHYDYDAAWTWALSMSRNERQARLKAIVSARSG